MLVSIGKTAEEGKEKEKAFVDCDTYEHIRLMQLRPLFVVSRSLY
jgi:hypothetical protein